MSEINFLIGAVLWGFALLIVCFVAVGFMPKSHPFYELLVALNKKLLVTLGLAAITPPIEFIPFVDIAFDVGAPLYLLWTWLSFFKDVISAGSPLRGGKNPLRGAKTLSPSPQHDVIELLPAPSKKHPQSEDAPDSYF